MIEQNIREEGRGIAFVGDLLKKHIPYLRSVTLFQKKKITKNSLRLKYGFERSTFHLISFENLPAAGGTN